MLRAAALSLALLTLLGCQKRARTDDETGSRTKADTVVTKREMRDTAVVTHDTTVSTDTTHMRGKKPVDVDTVHK
jgi:uncharacterized lipoprotein NlpE involved in copper resistance